MTALPARRHATPAMYAGLLLTVTAAAAPYVDRATSHLLADHLRDGYPASTHAELDTAVSTWLAILTAVGVLGAVGWVGAIWAVRAGKRWAKWTASALFVLGTSLALTTALVRDTSGEVGLAPQLGVLVVLPCVAGLLAVTALWRRG